MSELDRLNAIIRTTRRRLRLQMVLERATTCSALSLAAGVVLLFLYKTRTLGIDSLALGAQLAAGFVALGVLWGLLTPVRVQAVLKRLDRAHHTRDALGSSHDFLKQLATDPDHQHRAFMEAQVRHTGRLISKIDPARASRFRRPRDVGAVGVLSLALVAFGAMGLPAERSATAYVKPVNKTPGITLEAPYHQELTREIEKLAKLAKKLHDPAMAAFLKDYQSLLDALKRGDLTRREFEARHKALLNKHFPGIKHEQAQLKTLAAKIEQAGKAMGKSPALKRLSDAMKNHDLDGVNKALDALKKQLEQGKLSPRQRRKAAKALAKAAKALKQTKAELEKNRKADDALNKQIARQKQRIARLQKRLNKAPDKQTRDRLQRQFRKERKQLQRLQQQLQRLASQRRTLQRLSRTLKQLAQKMKRTKLDKETLALLAKVQKLFGKYSNQNQRGTTRAQGMMSAADLKQLLKRLLKKRPGNKGQLSDYLNKANGKRPCPSCHGSGKKPGGKPCPNCNGSGKGPGFLPGSKPGTGNLPGMGNKPGAGNGNKPGGNKPGAGNKPGTAHRPGSVNGRPTDLKANHTTKRADGKHGKGPSEVDVFRGGAQKGFSSVSYGKIYKSYAKIRQAVLDAEQVPPGYRDRIRRYFWLIRPR